jgi:hypothetical protein
MIKNFTEFISERKIGEIDLDVSIEIDLEATRHSDERKYRDDNFQQKTITDKEILETAEKAVSEITEDKILNILNIGDYVHIFNRSNDLNLIAVMQGKDFPLTMKIITVMRKRNFKAKSGTRTYTVS